MLYFYSAQAIFMYAIVVRWYESYNQVLRNIWYHTEMKFPLQAHTTLLIGGHPKSSLANRRHLIAWEHVERNHTLHERREINVMWEYYRAQASCVIVFSTCM